MADLPAYLKALLTEVNIWLNRHGTSTRMRQVDPLLLLLNLGVLLGASMVPWPTSVLFAALQEGNLSEATTAITVVGLASPVAALLLFSMVPAVFELRSTTRSRPGSG